MTAAADPTPAVVRAVLEGELQAMGFPADVAASVAAVTRRAAQGYRWRLVHLPDDETAGPSPAQVALMLAAADLRPDLRVAVHAPTSPWLDVVVAEHVRRTAARRTALADGADVVLGCGGRPPLTTVLPGGRAVWVEGGDVRRLVRRGTDWRFTRLGAP